MLVLFSNSGPFWSAGVDGGGGAAALPHLHRMGRPHGGGELQGMAESLQ